MKSTIGASHRGAHAPRPDRATPRSVVPGRQRPLGRALNDRTVGERIGERHADLEHVGAGAIERAQDVAPSAAGPDRRP